MLLLFYKRLHKKIWNIIKIIKKIQKSIDKKEKKVYNIIVKSDMDITVKEVLIWKLWL